MFVSGMNPYSSLEFTFPTLVITIPATILTLIWLASLYGAKLRITTASLFALGFISMFVSGGVSGLFLAQPSIDITCTPLFRRRPFPHGHGRRFPVRRLRRNLLLVPQNDGHMMSETLGKIHFWITFVGAYCIFMPFHYLAWRQRPPLLGLHRRLPPPLIPVHKFITYAAILTASAR